VTVVTVVTVVMVVTVMAVTVMVVTVTVVVLMIKMVLVTTMLLKMAILTKDDEFMHVFRQKIVLLEPSYGNSFTETITVKITARIFYIF
jgi:hypothetical protein